MKFTAENIDEEKTSDGSGKISAPPSPSQQPSISEPRESKVRFIKGFFIGLALGFLAYYASVLILLTIGAPIPAEYWLCQMLAIKKELLRAQAGKQKIILAGGSSTLFGVNAQDASKQLNMPVINFGLHAGLRLEEILWQLSSVVEPHDIVILLLEPPYFDTPPDMTSWQITNIIAWDREGWRAMGPMEKGKLIYSVPPLLCFQAINAEYQQPSSSDIVSQRTAALDSTLTITNFRNRPKPASFEYSAFLLDDHGDMLLNDGNCYSGSGWDYHSPNHIDRRRARCLAHFIAEMKARGVRVYFANTPYIAGENKLDVLQEAEQSFLRDLGSIGQMIDRREDLVFDRRYFFNTNLHLNTEGRTLRTDMLVRAIRQNVTVKKSD